MKCLIAAVLAVGMLPTLVSAQQPKFYLKADGSVEQRLSAVETRLTQIENALQQRGIYATPSTVTSFPVSPTTGGVCQCVGCPGNTSQQFAPQQSFAYPQQSFPVSEGAMVCDPVTGTCSIPGSTTRRSGPLRRLLGR